MDEGYGTARRQVAWNDFVLVGPSGDPAKIIRAKDASTAMKAIAAARARFVTRGDRSDANIAELRLWRLAGRTPEALTPEKWYRSVNGDMNQALNAASTTDAYTLSDVPHGWPSPTRDRWSSPSRAIRICSTATM
jgi:tungstate transport system substrate-binding protein